MDNRDTDVTALPPKASQHELLLDIFLTVCLMLLFAMGAKEMLDKDFDSWASNYPHLDE